MNRLSCKCGAVSGYIRDGSPSNRVRCYCTDCQAFGRFFGPAGGVLDPQGGTTVVQVAQSRLQIDTGLDQLACLRLKPKGLLRWYARCCNTPIGNTLQNPGISMVGLIHTCLDPATLDRDFGPVTAEVYTDTAIGSPKPRQHGLPGTIVKCLAMVIMDRLSGRYRRSPLFSQAGKPVAEPRILAREEVAALKRVD